jgi:hypothetical protein
MRIAEIRDAYLGDADLILRRVIALAHLSFKPSPSSECRPLAKSRLDLLEDPLEPLKPAHPGVVQLAEQLLTPRVRLGIQQHHQAKDKTGEQTKRRTKHKQ